MIVAVEGIDGSGKTTQAKMLAEKLRNAGYDAVYINPLLRFFPRKSVPDRISPRRIRTTARRGGFIRAILGAPGYFYALACYLSVRFRAGRKKVVVCDRYFCQFFFDLFGRFGLKMMAIFPRPESIFFLDGELETILSRITDPRDKNVPKEYYQQALDFYKSLSKRQKFIMVDALASPQEINQRIFTEVQAKLNGR